MIIMVQSKIPPPNAIEAERRKAFANPKRWIVDPNTVSKKDNQRVRAWAAEIMRKNEHKLNNNWKNGEIVTSGEVEVESIDVKNIYPFPDLQWYVYRRAKYWCLMLRSKQKLLATFYYLKID